MWKFGKASILLHKQTKDICYISKKKNQLNSSEYVIGVIKEVSVITGDWHVSKNSQIACPSSKW
jgi:hypothetical protein